MQQEGAKALPVIEEKTRERHFKGDGHFHGTRFKEELDHDHSNEHSDDDGHDHSHDENKSTLQMFLPAIISFVLLMIAIAFDNWLPQSWFTGWVRAVWYIIAYAPVGFPVIKEAFESIRKGDVFSEFLLMSIATIGAFVIGEYPEGVAVMLFYAVGEVFQTLAVTRAKANIKTLLDQRPDEVTILENNQPKTVKAETVNIGNIIKTRRKIRIGWRIVIRNCIIQYRRIDWRKQARHQNQRRNCFSRNDKFKDRCTGKSNHSIYR